MESMIFMNILGHAHSQRNIKAQENMSFYADPAVVIDKKTIDEFINEAGVGEEYIAEIELKLATKVDTIAKLDFHNRMEALNSVFAKSVETGFGLRDWMNKVGKNQTLKDLGLHKEKPYYLESVYRTNYTSAHSAGRYRNAQKSRVVQMMTFVGVQDSRQTDICGQFNGVTRLKTDKIWDRITPSNHYTCRSTVSELTESYIAINGIKESPQINIKSEPGWFDDNPAQNDKWAKPTKEMKKRLVEYEKQ